MYEWPVSSLRTAVPTACSGFPGTAVSLGLTDVSLGLMCPIAILLSLRSILVVFDEAEVL